METRKIAVFSSVVFETSSNRSIQNVIEGFLKRGCEVLYYTTHPFHCNYMDSFVAQYPKFRLVYIKASAAPVATTKAADGAVFQALKTKIKELFKYRKYHSNTNTLEWFGLPGTYGVIKRFGVLINENERELGSCDAFLFVDKFGGMLSHYLRLRYRNFWEKIEPRTVGYFLGTVLKQFRGKAAKAFFIMPINFLGSYGLPIRKLIITDDGTDGENIFKTAMRYRGEILFIRNGIDRKLIDFVPRPKTSDGERVSFVTCSRLSPWKRVDRAIRFLKCLRDKSGLDARLTVIGEGEERGRLEQLAQELGVVDHVIFTGALYYDEVLQALDQHEFCIVFNDLSGLGNQIYESIQLGLVPLVIDDGSTDSLLSDNFNAFKFPMESGFEEMASATFASRYSSGYYDYLSDNLAETRKLLFSWDQRNQKQYEFIFGSSHNG